MISRPLKILIALALLAGAAGLVRGQQNKSGILDQKKELEEIQGEVKGGKLLLDSLKNEELSVQKQVSDLDQRITSNRKLIQRLNSELKQVRRDITEAENKLETREETHERTRRRYLGSLRHFYLASRQPVAFVSDRPNSELESMRQVIYLSALADYESGNVVEAADYLLASIDERDRLSGEKKKVTSLKKKKETATSLDASRKERQQQQLETLRRKKTMEADRIIMLEQAARDMGNIITRLEEERRERQATAPQAPVLEPSVFITLNGQLPSPCRGEIVVPYGASIDPVTRLRSFSPGITLQVKSGRPVSAVASGSVAYRGELRGYGNFVIINHDNEYYSTYAGLGETYVKTGQLVQTGTRLALAGGEGQVKFELRKGRETLDPVKWISIDAF